VALPSRQKHIQMAQLGAYCQVDAVDLWYKFVNFAAETSRVSLNWHGRLSGLGCMVQGLTSYSCILGDI